jgi:hypothetical protein
VVGLEQRRIGEEAVAGSHVTFAAFAEFYPYYLSEHRSRSCRRLHFTGSLVVDCRHGHHDVIGEAWRLERNRPQPSAALG